MPALPTLEYFSPAFRGLHPSLWPQNRNVASGAILNPQPTSFPATANQKRAAQWLGWPALSAGTSSFALSSATSWLGLSFRPNQNKQLLAVRVFISAIAGTPVAGDCGISLYPDSQSVPNSGSAIESHNSAGAPAVGVIDVTGFTFGLTAGTQYWIVVKNNNGTPGTNNFTLRTVTGQYRVTVGSGGEGWLKSTTTTGDGGWGAATDEQSSLRLAYADGTFEGLLLTNSASATDLVYNVRESGVKFTTPPNATLNVRGIAMLLSSATGSPLGPVRFGLRQGAGAAAYTLGIPGAADVTNRTLGWYFDYFSANQVIPPGTVCRVTLADGPSNPDTAANSYRLNLFTLDADANSEALGPLEGTTQQTYTTDGSTFTDTLTGLYGFALLLDSAGEFAVQGSFLGARGIMSGGGM